jgi:hypothetical protein
MKSKEEIEAKILALVEQMRNKDRIKHANIRCAIDALEWVIGELEDPNSVMHDAKT